MNRLDLRVSIVDLLDKIERRLDNGDTVRSYKDDAGFYTPDLLHESYYN